MKITKDQVQYLQKHYKKYSNAKLGKALKHNKDWVYLALSELQLVRTNEDRLHIQRNVKQNPPNFVEQTNIPHIISSTTFTHKAHLLFLLAIIALLYIISIPTFPAGIYGSQLAVCATDYGLPSTASPLYIFASNAWCYFDVFGCIAWQLQLLSTICTLATCAILALLFYSFAKDFVVASVLTILFALATPTWESAITVSPIPLAMMFFSISLYFCMSWYEDPQERKIAIITVSLVASIATHVFFIVFIPAILLFLFTVHRDYKFSQETIFSTLLLLFLGLNIFLVIPFASWNHTSMNPPQGFIDTIQYIIQPISELQFTSFSLKKFAMLSTSSLGISANTIIALPIFAILCWLTIYSFKQTAESKPVFSKLLLSIAITYIIVFTIVATTNTTPDATQSISYLSSHLLMIIAIALTQIESKYKLAFFILMIVGQLFVNPTAHINNNFIHTYSKHILKNSSKVIISDKNSYWPLVYTNKDPQIKIFIANNTQHKQQLMQENANASLTYVDPTSLYNRMQRNGLLWQPQKNPQQVPQWSTTTKSQNSTARNLVSQYHLINAMHFLQKEMLEDALIQINKAKKHSNASLKILTRYAQQTAAKKNYQDVSTVYQHLQQRFPNNANYIVAIARVKNIQGKIEAAEKHYKQALQIAPRNFYANIELAKLYENSKRVKQAQQIYENLTKFYPKNPYAYKKLAQIYAEDNKNKAAEMNKKSQELEKNKDKKPSPKPTIPKVPNPKSMLPQLPKIPQPQDFYPKIPNPIPGRKQQ